MEKENIYVLNQEDSIAINNNFIEVKVQNELKKYNIDELKKVSIVTTDKGPFIDDTSLLLQFENSCLIFPSENPLTEIFLFEQLAKFVKIDFEEVIKASSSTDNKEFILYKSLS